MPVFTYEPRTINDKSTLTPGMHPAFLLAIRDEEVPDGWQMKEKSPRMWRWVFAVWATPQDITNGVKPEKQSATSSQTFSPGGKYQPSKAYVWTCKLLGRKIAAGESVDLDPSLPLPCQVMVTRTKQDGTPIEYANLPSLEAWPDGLSYLTPEFRTALVRVLEEAPATQAATPPVAQPQYAQPAQMTQAPPAQPQVQTGWSQTPQPQQPTLPGTPPPRPRTW